MTTPRAVRFVPRAGRRRWRALALTALLGCALAACAGDQPAPQQDLGGLLIDHVPGGNGYVLDQQVSGPLGAESASTATPMDPGQLARALAEAHFQGGYARVWQSGASYATALIFSFPGGGQAAAVVDAERSYLQSALGVVVSADPSIPGAWTYILYGDTRARARGVFCQGEWLAVGRYAVSATTCSDHPGDVSTVRGMASVEDALLLHATGQTPPPSSPSPSA